MTNFGGGGGANAYLDVREDEAEDEVAPPPAKKIHFHAWF